MDAASLLDDILLQAFHYLPFKDRVRISRVSKWFNRISTESIRKTKFLELDDDMVAYCVSTDQVFPWLLEQCSLTVKRMRVGFKCNKHMLKALTEFVYPKLANLEIALLSSWPTDDDYFRQCVKDLIVKNRSVKCLILRSGLPFEMPEGITLDNLERLELFGSPNWLTNHVSPNYNSLFRSLAGVAPNLKCFKLKSFDHQYIPSITVSSIDFDSFFASVPNLSDLRFDRGADDCPGFKECPHFWHLSRLKSLEFNVCVNGSPFCYKVVNADFFKQMSASFPNLESFVSNASNAGEADGGSVCMSTMKHLREFRMRRFSITTGMITAIMESCPTLRYLDVFDIFEVDTPEKLVNALKTIAHIGARKISIRFKNINHLMLNSGLVKMALKEIKAERQLEIELGKVEEY